MMAAEQLKASILQLAMQGKLVEQRPEEGTGEELCRKIIKRKGGNSNSEEYPIDIPETWHWVQLDNVCDLYTGNSIPENVKKNKYMKDIEGYPYIATKDVQFDNTVKYDNGVIIPFTEDFRHAYKGAILMCIEGGSAGKKIALINRDVCFGNKLCMLNSITISNKYIYYYLQSPLFQGAFRNGITGIIGGVSIKKIKGMWLPLPPLSEQKRIIAKVEELMSFVDQYATASTKLNTLNATFPNQMKKSILQQAVMGNLVPQDPSDEPASLLLKKIEEEKKRLIKEGKIKKQKPLPEITEDEIPFDIPESWEWVRIGDIFRIGTGLTPLKGNALFYDGGTIPWVTSALTSERYITQTDSNVTKYAVEHTNLTVYPIHSLVIAMYGQGKTRGQVSELLIEATTNQACAVLEYYLYYPELTEYTYNYFMFNYDVLRKKAEGTSQPNLNLKKIAETIIPIPPLDEQKRIVAKTKEILESIKHLSSEL